MPASIPWESEASLAAPVKGSRDKIKQQSGRKWETQKIFFFCSNSTFKIPSFFDLCNLAVYSKKQPFTAADDKIQHTAADDKIQQCQSPQKQKLD